MRHHAKAPSIGSTTGARGSSLIGRVLATLGVSHRLKGSGAFSRGLRAAGAVVVGLCAVAFAANAFGAGKVVLGTFGNASGVGGGAVKKGNGLAVNRTGVGGVTAGDVYVGDASNHRIQELSATGAFVRAWGMGVVPGSASGTANLTSVSGTGTLTSGSTSVTAVTGSFTVGQTISGTGIPSGTTISTVGAGTLTLSATATASGAGVVLTGGEVASVVTTSRAFVVGQTVTGSGIPSGTTITAVTTGVGAASKLTFSNAVTATATNVTLTVAESPGNVPTNGTQVVTVPGAATGTYKLKFKRTSPTEEAETVAIPVAATAGEVEGALRELANIGSGNVAVTESASRTYVVEFKGARFTDTNVEQLTVAAQPTGGTVTVATTQEGAAAQEVCTTSCSAGVASGAAGGLSEVQAVAVDQTTGVVYVVDKTNLRVSVYSATGVFEGAFGWKVNAKSPQEELQFCTSATGCQAGTSKESAGAFSTLQNGGVAVEPGTGNVYVSDAGNSRINEFGVTVNGGHVVTGVSFIRAIGWKVNVGSPAEAVQTCTTVSGCQKGKTGSGVGEFGTGAPGPVAVDPNGDIYAVNVNAASPSTPCSATAPCGIFKFNPDGSFKEMFGPSAGESTSNVCELTYTSGVSQRTEAAFDIAVDPSDNHVFVAKYTALREYRLYEFNEEGGKSQPASEKCVVSPPFTTSALPGGVVFITHGLAIGTEERVYAENTESGALGHVVLFGPAPAPSAKMLPVTQYGSSTAKFVGQVTPPAEVEGQTFATTWHFEYTINGIEWTQVPLVDGSAGSTPGVPVTVEEFAVGLSPNTRYQVRLCATTAQTVCSATAQFTTVSVAPTVISTYPEAGKTEATLGAQINPNNLPTTYHFEWTTNEHWQETHAYDHRVPAFERNIGSGSAAIVAQDTITGLQPASQYHFRIVTQNTAGTTNGRDQELETLDSCGLPDGRCFELVSPADKGPAGVVTTLYQTGGFQAASGGGAVVYPYLNPAEATAGGGLMYLAQRSASGWSSTQLNAPALVRLPVSSLIGSPVGMVQFNSPDLSCSIVQSFDPVTDDVPATDVEFGARNLFSRDAEGNWRLLTTPVPVNATTGPQVSNFNTVYGASPDCSRVYFLSEYQYLSGNPSGLYESDNGTVRDAGLLPDGSTPAGGHLNAASHGYVASATGNAVSKDGTKLFFTSNSDKPATNGKQAVFVRDGGASVEVSEKRGGANNSLGSRFGAASQDGSHVFFISTYGLTPASSAGTAEACNSFTAGEAKTCDLYDYDTETGHLTDLSADTNGADTKGAVVQQVLGASEEGGLVYFTALGQLIPGKGKTYAENTAPASAGARTVNVYLSEEGVLHYVTTVGVSALESPKVTLDGRHLLFTSAKNLTGYESGGPSEAYLYSASSGEIQCVSCRRNGQPASASVVSPKVSEDGRVFFVSRDALAPGAVQGNLNVYEWKRGQVFLLVAGQGRETSTEQEQLYGITPSGDDVFFGTSARLVSQDVDSVADLYDARVDGGFPPQPAPASCDPEVNCQGEALVAPLASSPASAAFSGPGNPTFPVQKVQETKKQQSKKKKQSKSKKRQSKKKQNKKKQRKKKLSRKRKQSKRALRSAKTYRGGAK